MRIHPEGEEAGRQRCGQFTRPLAVMQGVCSRRFGPPRGGGATRVRRGRIVDASLPVAAEAGAEYDALLRDGSNTETQSHGDTEQSRASAPLGLCASVLKSTRPEGRIPAFSPAALAVFDAGRALYRYYHAQPGAIPDASLYDIRAHFQGFKPNGHMNADSPDPEYTRLIADLRAAERALAAKIAPKVRQHGFLR